jgi:putative nucleotidyltransferase with HDIG domain
VSTKVSTLVKFCPRLAHAHPRAADPGQDRWEGHRILGVAVSAFCFAAPLAASIAVPSLLDLVVGQPRSMGWRVLWWTSSLAASAVAFLAVQWLARRALPLASVLSMSLVFPDRAPSRLAVARRAGTVRDLRAHVDQGIRGGASSEPAKPVEDIVALAVALSSHDRATRGHCERVRALTDLLASELRLTAEDRERLRWAALLHDIGKLSVHPDILNKREELDTHEWEILRGHPLEGLRLAAPLIPWLGEWALAIDEHHERFDGTGYPYGLQGDQIALAARIVAVADVFDTMTARRTYRDAVSTEAARAELARCAGSQFDPATVRAFLNISIGRLRWVVGPGALVAQLPFLAGESTGALAGVASRAAVGTAIGIGALIAPPIHSHAHLPVATVRQGSVATAALATVTLTTTVPQVPTPTTLTPQTRSRSIPGSSAPAASEGSLRVWTSTPLPEIPPPTSVLHRVSLPPITVPAVSLPSDVPPPPVAPVAFSAVPITTSGLLPADIVPKAL